MPDATTKITVDTNVLVRVMLGDDAKQAGISAAMMAQASLIAILLPCLCELVWVLRRGAKLGREEVAGAIYDLVQARNVVTNRLAVEAGLAMLRAGSDFADGVIAYEGEWLGGETFVSFDRDAIGLLAKAGKRTRLLP